MNLKAVSSFSSSLIYDDMADVEWEKFESSVLIEVKRGDDIFTSTAVVIRRNILLTCAHSVESADGGRVFWDAQYKPHSKKFVSFKKVIIHPRYNQKKSNYANDLAVIVLDGNMPSKTRPAKIYRSPEKVRPGMQVHRLGFGERNGMNCRTWTNPEIESYDNKTMSFICKDEKGVIGDSGGPLYLKSNGQYQLFALHSTKEGADKTYTVSLADHLSWIKFNTTLREA
ncbi:MAG: hypothetical protein CME64_12850 [Halobacteriovoraceae bacterium]|nr:hypothetical protein [Halobacteriovoraceae bacterium]|tara:strand:- start:123493 stop:124173 length:681 start_codon:yes stop_codon:yes gene_type:complete